MSVIKIGINPLSWTNDDLPTLGGDIPLEQCLSEGKYAGFSGFELGQKFPRDPAILAATLDAHQLRLVSGWFSGYILENTVEDEIERIKPHIDLLKKLGSQTVVYCDITDTIQGQATTPLSQRRRLIEAEWEGFCNKLTQLADYTLSEGIKLSYHHHMGTVIQTQEEVEKMMSMVGSSVYLLLDTGHMLYAGGDPVAIATQFGRRTAHVHCKDMRGDIMNATLNKDRSFIDGLLDGVFTIPGDGCVDFPAVLSALHSHHYSGWLVIEAEQDPVVAQPVPTVNQAFRNIQTLATDAGFSISGVSHNH